MMSRCRRLGVRHRLINAGGVRVTGTQRVQRIRKHVRVTTMVVVMVVSGLLKTIAGHTGQGACRPGHTTGSEKNEEKSF